MENLLVPVTIFAALGCGLMTGLFFAFSNFVMNALARLQPNNGIAAMQSINVAVLNPLFFLWFLGTAAACLFLGFYGLWRWDPPLSIWLLAGSALYLLGTFAVTAAGNVPLNEILANLDPMSAEAIGVWRDYVARWSAWNHVRTVASLLAAASFAIALVTL